MFASALRRFSVLAALVMVTALVGCASRPGGGSPPLQSPQQVVFAAKSSYQVALTAAVAYKRLPVCATPRVLPCHDPAILAQIQKADNVAAAALDAAENAVRTPQVGDVPRSKAITAAQTALAALTAITTTIGSTK